MQSSRRLAIDVGGTFIDFVSFDPVTNEVVIEKVPSSGELEDRVFEGIDRLGTDLSEVDMIVHGSTIVLNTILQERGARVVLVTTRGFRDVLELGRGNRRDIYDLFYTQPEPLVPRHRRFEITERLDHLGGVVTPLNEVEVSELVDAINALQPEAVAICFLHAYANPVHEKRLADLLRDQLPGVLVSASHEIVREFREYERTSTTVLNSYTQPRMSRYLGRLQSRLDGRDYQGAFTIMQSSGGITTSQVAGNAPIRTIQSGPAGGAIGAAALGRELGLDNIVAADVGGTTFDVALIANGASLERTSTELGRRAVLQPTIDIASVGAGGGSIAYIDEEGGVQVGPRSAQAEPGPACFGLGGTEPTVTDAQVMLGYLDPKEYLGRRMQLDVEAARAALLTNVATPLGLSVEEAAAGVVHLANMNMVHAIRQVTIERGHDPREFVLVCYGGGGGLFVSALLEELELKAAVVPRHPAAFSAWGLLSADYREDVSRTFVQPLANTGPSDLRAEFDILEEEAREWFRAQRVSAAEIEVQRSAELRYLGQEHAVSVTVTDMDLAGADLTELRQRFDSVYAQAFSHSLPTHELEFVNLRLSIFGRIQKPTPKSWLEAGSQEEALAGYRSVIFEGRTEAIECPVYDRGRLPAGSQVNGPAIVEEWNSTVLIRPGQSVAVDDLGNLRIEVAK